MHPSRRGRRLGGGGGGEEWWMSLPIRSLVRGAYLFGRGGPPAGLPYGSQIPTFSSFGIRPLSTRGGTSITMCRPAVWVRGHAVLGGGGVPGLLSVRPHFRWGLQLVGRLSWMSPP